MPKGSLLNEITYFCSLVMSDNNNQILLIIACEEFQEVHLVKKTRQSIVTFGKIKAPNLKMKHINLHSIVIIETCCLHLVKIVSAKKENTVP